MTSRGIGLVMAAALVVAMGAVSIGACVGDDPQTGTAPIDGSTAPTPTTTPPTQEAAAVGNANGTDCKSNGDCSTGHCIDGVCCETVCDGTCERCDDKDSRGKCTAIKEGLDPDNECPTTPLDLDAGGDPDATSDASLLLADGGLPPPGQDSQCAGRCNGKRACRFPDGDRVCGATFCTTPTAQGIATCDGEGHCLYGQQECSAYVCPEGGGGCNSMCTANEDCQATHFCGTDHKCAPKVENGAACDTLAACKSGFCVEKVCCNSPCVGDNSFSCGGDHLGTCTCNQCAGGAACALFYADKDGDGYGDKLGNVDAGTAKYGCQAGSLVGFVQNNQDCFDDPAAGASAGSVNPDAGFHSGPYVKDGDGGLWDWNCNGASEPEFPVVKSTTTCHTCVGTTTCAAGTGTTCRKGFPAPTGHSCLGFGKVCNVDKVSAFRETTKCGDLRTLYTCGTCDETGIEETPTSNKLQRCK